MISGLIVNNYLLLNTCNTKGHSLQEVIQNADDARATEVKFFLDCRQLQTLPHGLVRDTEKHDELSRFYGPFL